LGRPDSKQGNVIWKAEIEEKNQKEKATTEKERTDGNKLVSDAEAMEMERFKSQ
jgi:thiamine pyrophosphokinase